MAHQSVCLFALVRFIGSVSYQDIRKIEVTYFKIKYIQGGKPTSY